MRTLITKHDMTLCGLAEYWIWETCYEMEYYFLVFMVEVQDRDGALPKQCGHDFN